MSTIGWTEYRAVRGCLEARLALMLVGEKDFRAAQSTIMVSARIFDDRPIW